MKIFLLKPSSLGDVIQALPVLRLLKKHWPHSQVHWWLAEDLLPLLAGDPDLAGIITFRRQGWQWLSYWTALFGSVRQIRDHRFDLVIDLQSLARSGLIAWLARGRFTIGLDDPREKAAIFYDRAVPRPSHDTHAVDWYLEVLRILCVPTRDDFVWLPARPDVAKSVREKWRPDDGRWLIINPGARWANKRWPASHYADLVRRLASDYPTLRYAILGTGADAPLGKVIAEAAPHQVLDLTGQTSLPEMVEWIRLAELVVTNDTGPMHVAVALGKPVVALFGPTNPRRTGPYRQLQNVVQTPLPCVPCLKQTCRYRAPLACLREITPESVCAEVSKRLNS